MESLFCLAPGFLIDEENKPILWDYSDPANYLEIAGAYNLRICLAHMGGKIHLEDEEANIAGHWRKRYGAR